MLSKAEAGRQVVIRLRRSLFKDFEDDPAEVELVFVEVRPFDDCAGGRTADLLGREVVADRIFNADQAIDGQRISKGLPASDTVLRSVGFTAALGIGTFRQIVAIVVALAPKSARGDDLFQRGDMSIAPGAAFRSATSALMREGPHQRAAL
jgi:hypothetical protein